jgi:hypothetical protein
MVDSHCHRRALVDSLARPGGNATGFLFGDYSLSEKWPPYIKNPQMTMVIDRDHGVSVDQVRQELYNCFGARQVSTIYTAVERLLRDPGVRSAGPGRSYRPQQGFSQHRKRALLRSFGGAIAPFLKGVSREECIAYLAHSGYT